MQGKQTGGSNVCNANRQDVAMYAMQTDRRQQCMQCKQTGGNNFCTAQIQKVHCSNVCIAQTEDSNVSIAHIQSYSRYFVAMHV